MRTPTCSRARSFEVLGTSSQLLVNAQLLHSTSTCLMCGSNKTRQHVHTDADKLACSCMVRRKQRGGTNDDQRSNIGGPAAAPSCLFPCPAYQQHAQWGPHKNSRACRAPRQVGLSGNCSKLTKLHLPYPWVHVFVGACCEM